MESRAMRVAWICGALLATAVAAGSTVRFTPAQSRYLEGCGGCHGIDGSSPRTGIPELRASVGRFLCTADGR